MSKCLVADGGLRGHVLRVRPPGRRIDQIVCFKSKVPFRQFSEITICIQKSWRLYFWIHDMEGVLNSHHLASGRFLLWEPLVRFLFFLSRPPAARSCLLGGWLQWPPSSSLTVGRKAVWIEKETLQTRWAFLGDNLLPCFIKPGTGMCLRAFY